MADKGIIFSAPMVRALLDGRKTQTRRYIRPKPWNQAGDTVDIGIAESARFTVGADGRHYLAFDHPKGGPLTAYVSPCTPGDRLYVREAWSHTGEGVWDIAAARVSGRGGVIYSADGRLTGAKYWPSIHMPREFSRLWLRVTDVRVQRVQEISGADSIAEGIKPLDYHGETRWRDYEDPNEPLAALAWMDPRFSFRSLWRTLHAREGQRWGDNPWIVAVTFEVNRGNIDARKAA